MTLLKEDKLAAVASAIENAEKKTDAELVAVLARQADDYRYIPTLWAACLALLVPGALWLGNFWLDSVEVLVIQLAVFAILAGLLRLPFLLFRLIPRSVRRGRAHNLAHRQFLENNLHHTDGDCGVLVFISEAEHYVEIIADRGISQHVSGEQWQQIVDALIAAIKRGETQSGLISCIDSCGELLAQYAPVTAEKNELPNHLVLI